MTARTRAILPVHLFGQPADMEAINATAAEHGLYVVEDCAQAFGGSTDAGRLGALGDAGAFSFFPSKNLGACGDNSRLDELQAVVLRHKLPHIDHYNAERRRAAERYDAGLAQLAIDTPMRADTGTHVFHQYTVLSERRDAIMEHLSKAGIASAIYYPVPLHRQPAFADAGGAPSLPQAERVAERCLSLPMFPELTGAQIDRICGVIAEALDA